jgi:hypothetical protein
MIGLNLTSAYFKGLLASLCMATSLGTLAAEIDNPTFISDGSVVKFDQDRASLMPISGWDVSPKSLQMSLIMREKQPQVAVPDYSKPLFSRNITVMTINEASPIDELRAQSFQEEFSKMMTRDINLKDFQFTNYKFFNYKGENDGLVFYSQHVVNGFPMMQMMVLVSGESKQYLLTYTDLASQFANTDTYNAAWKSMTSVTVQGVAPKRYYKEAKVAGAGLAGFLLLIAPFVLARLASQRRIKRAVEDLQNEWDSNAPQRKPVNDELSNISQFDATRVAKNVAPQSKKPKSISLQSGRSSELSSRLSSISSVNWKV